MSQTYTFKSNDPFSSHAKILSLIETSGTNLKILDVGCAGGYIAEILKKEGHEVYGIELDKESAKKASKFCKKVFLGDIEYIDIPIKYNFFDVIICGDVLEHLKDPFMALIKLKKYLKREGYIVISTGNVANIYIRLNLLFGRFDYEDRGILDKTHCKLFTLKSLKEMIQKANMRITDLKVAPIPLPLVLNLTSKGKVLYFIHIINYFLTLSWKRMFGYQFIVKVNNEK